MGQKATRIARAKLRKKEKIGLCFAQTRARAGFWLRFQETYNLVATAGLPLGGIGASVWAMMENHAALGRDLAHWTASETTWMLNVIVMWVAIFICLVLLAKRAKDVAGAGNATPRKRAIEKEIMHLHGEAIARNEARELSQTLKDPSIEIARDADARTRSPKFRRL